MTFLMSTISMQAQVKSATSFVGDCVRKIGNIEDPGYCDNNIVNLNFQDGYVSFQFNSKEKLKNGHYKDSISFVGPGLKKQQDNSKTAIYLPVEQLTFADGMQTKLTTKKIENSVCLLGFSYGDLNPENLRYLQCHYQKGNNVVIYKASNIKLNQLNNTSRDNDILDKTNYNYIFFEKISCDDYALILTSTNSSSINNPIVEKLKSLKFTGVGPLYVAGAITCECKMRGVSNLKQALLSINDIHKRSKKYNVPYNIIKTGFLSSLGDSHSAEWRNDFYNWTISNGSLPNQDKDGNPTCAVISQ